MLKRLFEQNDTTMRPPSTAQFLTFKLGEDEYGINIQNVQELRGYNTVTPVAKANDYIKGVINLRGMIVPIIDLRIKFSVGTTTYDQFTSVMVLTIGSRVIGVIVDSVSTLLNIAPEQIELPSRTRQASRGYVSRAGTFSGVGLIANRRVHLIDTEALYASIDFGSVERLITGATTSDAPIKMARDRIFGSRYFWVRRVGEQAQVSALKFRPHWRPAPK
jgi:purine-binding chemotaxis protein CheW